MPVALLVEDDPQIRRLVRSALENEGWSVFEVNSMKRGVIDAGTRKPDLLIVDLGLPDGSGINLIREVRTWSQVPIIVLSARVDETDKIEALDAGADDYMTKPFGIGELLARSRANLRRPRRSALSVVAETEDESESDPIFKFGDIEVDFLSRTVKRLGSQIHLTPIEYRLLTVLVQNVSRVLTHKQLLTQVWGTAASEHSHYLRIYMGHLRQKLEIDPTQPKHFMTETGIGYRMVK
jgi:two-component system KDP operon response regulator KdpE